MNLGRSAALAALALAVVAPARAQGVEPSPGDRAVAEALFRDARKLLADGKAPEACAKFAESERLDPTLGTLLNLAVCHAQIGKTASAWAEFTSAAAMAARAGQADREQFARDQAREVEQRLSKLVISAAQPPPGLEVKLNGEVLRAAVLGSPLPVDPGTITVEASAPGKKPWSQTLQIGLGPSTASAWIPALADAASSPVAAAPAKPGEPAAKAQTRSPTRRDDDSDATRTAGWVAVGAGVVGLGIGSYYGLRTLSKKSDESGHCQGSGCDQIGLTADQDAHKAATISTIAFGLGLAATGVGAWLLLSSSEDDRAGKRVGAAPAVGPGTGGLVVSGAW